MKRATMFIMLSFTAVSLIFSAQTPAEIAKQYFTYFFQGNAGGMLEVQDSTMNQLFGKPQISQSLQSMTSSYGKFEQILNISEVENQGYRVFLFYTKMEKAWLQVTISLDGENKVAGFFAKQVGSPNSALPPYADNTLFTERTVAFGLDKWPIEGSLTLPNNQQEFPIVILIGGSGPTDKDTTIGPNKPFRDIAYGLSSKGIAVLRYHKRTYAHGQKMLDTGVSENGEVWDEYLEDISEAIAYAQSIKNVTGIYLSGHSLGGHAAVIAASKFGGVKGLILLASSARRFAQISIDQNRYFFPATGLPESQLEAVVAFFQSILDHQLPADTLIQPGLYVSYMYDWDKYPIFELLGELAIPTLVLQGEEDFQATMEGDYLQLMKSFGNSARFTFHSFPGLNHLFHKTEMDMFHTTDEYNKEGFVDYEVVDALANWIFARD